VLSDHLQGPGWPSPARLIARLGGAASEPLAWLTGSSILVPGGGTSSARVVTAGAAPHLVVAALSST
jgi:hypothetical protein